MSYNPQNPNGQATSANSAPVVIASDQSVLPVDGNAAAGASDSGNPVKVGGKYNASAPTLADGQRGDLQLDASGNLKVNITTGGGSSVTQYAEGATAATATGTLALGKSGTTLKATQTDASGNLRIDLSQTSANTTAIKVDGSGVTQPVSGTVTVTPSGTQSVNTAQVAGVTVATAATGVQKVGLTDGSGNAITSTSSALDVNIKSGSSSSAATADEAAWTAGTSVFAPSGGVFNDSAATLTSGQQGTTRVTANRGAHTNLRNSAGTEIATASNPLQVSLANTATNATAIKVDGSAVTQPVSGTVSVNALPTGTNSLGTVGLNTGTNSIGTVGLNAGANNIGGVEIFDSGGTNKLAVNASGQAAVTPTGGDLTSGSQTTKVTDGTNTANVGVGDSSNGFAFTGSGHLTQTFSLTNGQTSTVTDVGNYRWVSVQFTSVGTTSGGTTFQCSNDNSTFASTTLVSSQSVGANAAVSATTAAGIGIYHGPLTGRYFRLSCVIGGGTAAGTIIFSTMPMTLASFGVAASQQTANWSVNATQLGGAAINTGNGTTGTGTARVTISSDSTGQVALSAGANAIGDVNLNPAARGGWSISSQTSLTTTATVSAAAGKFGGYMFVNLNSAPAYIQVFDTTGAVTLGTTTPTFVVPIPANATPANGAGANVEFANGLTVANGIKVAATTTATGATAVTTGLTGFVLYK